MPDTTGLPEVTGRPEEACAAGLEGLFDDETEPPDGFNIDPDAIFAAREALASAGATVLHVANWDEG